MFTKKYLLSIIFAVFLLNFGGLNLYSKEKLSSSEIKVKEKSPSKEISEKKSSIEQKKDKALLKKYRKESQKSLKSMRSALEEVQSAKIAEKNAYILRDDVVSSEKIAVSSVKIKKDKKDSEYSNAADVANQAMNQLTKIWKKVDIAWENESFDKKKSSHSVKENYKAAVSARKVLTDAYDVVRQAESRDIVESIRLEEKKTGKFVDDAYSGGISARKAEKVVFDQAEKAFITSAQSLDMVTKIFKIKSSKESVQKIFDASEKINQFTASYHDAVETLIKASLEERQTLYDKRNSIENFYIASDSYNEILYSSNEDIIANNAISYAYNATLYANDSSKNIPTLAWKAAKDASNESEKAWNKVKFSNLYKSAKAKEKELWDVYRSKKSISDIARDAVLAINPKEVSDNAYIQAWDFYLSKEREVQEAWDLAWKIAWSQASAKGVTRIAQDQAIEVFKSTWDNAKVALIAVNVARTEVRNIIKESLIEAKKATQEISKNEDAKEISEEVMKVFNEIEKAL